MAIGFWVVKGDKTTCGGSVLTGHPKGKQIGPNHNHAIFEVGVNNPLMLSVRLLEPLIPD